MCCACIRGSEQSEVCRDKQGICIYDVGGWHGCSALFNLKRQFQWRPRGAAVCRFEHTYAVRVSPVPISSGQPKVVGITGVDPNVGHPQWRKTHPRRRRPMFGPHPKSAKGPQLGHTRVPMVCSSCGSMRTRLIRPAPPWVGTLRGPTCRPGQCASSGGRNRSGSICLQFSDASTKRFSGPSWSVPRVPLPTMPSGRMPFRRMTATRCAIPPELRMPLEPSRDSHRGLTSMLSKFGLF